VRDDSGTIEKVFEEPGLAGTDPTETIDWLFLINFISRLCSCIAVHRGYGAF